LTSELIISNLTDSLPFHATYPILIL